MEFKVRLKLPNPTCRHIRNLTNTVGMDFINEIHKEIGVKVPTSQLKIHDSCPSFNNSEKYIFVTEQYLSSIPHFNARHDVDVFVPDGFLGKFWEMKIETDGFHSSVGMIRETIYTILNFFKIKTKGMKYRSNYSISFELNETAVIREWILSNCPLYWNTSIEAVEETNYKNKETLIIRGIKSKDSLNYEINKYQIFSDNIYDVIIDENQHRKTSSHDSSNEVCALLQKSHLLGIFEMICENVEIEVIERFEDIIEDVCVKKRKLEEST